MALARNIGGYFHAVREAHAGDLTDGGVRLARGLRGHLCANAALKRRGVKSRAVFECIEATSKRRLARLRRFRLPPLLGELVDGGH